MAAIGISFGGFESNPSFLCRKKSNQFSSSNPFLCISNHAIKIPQKIVFLPKASSNVSVISPPAGEAVMAGSNRKDSIFVKNTESWIQESVPHIVSNLNQAPLLVKIYSENGRMLFKTEMGILEKWCVVKREWENGESKCPNGLIFVEELGQKNGMDCEIEEGVTKAWGVVVQEKGSVCESACYLLKTNRVCGGMGLGFCTHFCLMKVNNFRDSALEQFTDSWLLK